ncbi:MAG: hypothetical protein KC731_11710, partial [Myxococcales bacterium]|nr:hypothetical protein [Myxococcales bacterium]
PALAVLRGFGSASDGYHPTAPDPTGSGTRRASAMALAHAGLAPKDVDHYDAHGSGTEEGDAAEWQGVVALLGERANELSVSASKGQIGHCLGAAGILELIAVVEARRRGLVPPSLRPPELRPSTPPRLVVDHPSSQVVQHSLCHNAAFGGNYASLVVSAANEVGAKPTRDGGAVILAGALARSGHPEAPEAWRSPTDADGHLRLGPPPQRGLDHLGQLLLVATRGALASAGARLRARPDPEATAGSLLRERVGLFVGATHASQSALADFWSRIHRLGLDQVSGRSFARLTINAPAGALSRASELFGPFCVIAEGPGSGLKAAALARETLRRSDDVDAIVVAAAFERGPPGEAEDEDLAETTAAVVLARAEVLASPRRPVIDEVVFGGPGCGPPRRNGRLFAADSIAAGGHSEAADLLALVAAADFAQQCGERARASAYNPATGWSAISLRPPTDG